MAVQVPVVKRNAPMETPSVGRVDIKPPNVTEAQSIQSKAINEFAKDAVDLVAKEEIATADVKSTEAATKYRTWYETNLRGKNGLSYLKGDPAEAYAKFDEDARKEYDRIINESAGYSQLTKDAIVSKLNTAHNRMYESRVTLEGKQNADYRTRVTNDAVVLSQNDVVDAAATLDVKDPNTLIPIERSLNEIRNLRYKEGRENGLVRETVDPNVIDPNTKSPKVLKIESDPSFKAQVAKDVSDALVMSIENLTAAGDVAGAEFLMNKYADQIIGNKKPKVEKFINTAAKDNQAKAIVKSLINLPEDQAIKKLDDIQDDDVREKASKRYDSEKTRRNRLIKSASTANYNAAANIILNRDKKGLPFQDEVQMMDDPEIKRLWINITDAKQKMALQHMVNQPKDSNQDVKNDAFSMLFEGKFQGMPPEQFNEAVAGLNKSDRTMFESEYRKINTQTGGEQNQQLKWMGSQLEKELQTIKYIKKDQYGKYAPNDRIKLNEASSELIIAMDKFPPNASFKEKQEWIKQFAVQKIKEKGETPPPPEPKFKGDTSKPDTSGVKGPKVDQDQLKKNQEVLRQYYAKYQRWPNKEELADALKNGVK